jgi:hypothetical protein
MSQAIPLRKSKRFVDEIFLQFETNFFGIFVETFSTDRQLFSVDHSAAKTKRKFCFLKIKNEEKPEYSAFSH